MYLPKMNLPAAAFVVLAFTASSASAQILDATERENQKLVTVNLATNAITTLFNTPGQPDSLVIDTQGRLIYSQPLDNQVRRFDPVTSTDVLIAGAAVGINSPQDMILEPAGQFLLVSNDLANTITRTNLTTLVTTPFATLPRPQGIVFDTAGNLYVLAGFGTAANGIYQLNPITGAILRSNLGFDPTNQLDGLTFDPSTGFLFATSSGLISGSNAVYKINTGTLAATPLATVPQPDGIINDNNGTLFVASRTGFVYSVNEATGVATQRSPVPTLDDLGIAPPQPPTERKIFTPNTVAQGGTSTLMVTITNPNGSIALTGVGFNDAFPAGLIVATPPNIVNNCGGAVTGAAGATSFSLTGGIIAGGAFCSVSINVIDNNPDGTQSLNCVTATSQNGGIARAQSCDTLAVAIRPVFTKTFNPKTVTMGGTSIVTVTVTNLNTTALTGVGFTDPLPIGVVVAATPNLVNNCGGTVTGATAGSPTFSLAGATLAPNPGPGSSCTVSLNVSDNNMPGVASQNCIAGTTACDTLTVFGPPQLTKSFTPPSVQVGGNTTLSFIVTNPNATVTLNGVGFVDTLPPGVIVGTPPNLVNNCGGAVTGATAGSTTFSLAGVTLAGGAVCTVSLNTTGTTAGVKINTSGPITSTNGGNGPPATAMLTVVGPPAITKSFNPTGIPLGGSSILSFTLTNSNTTVALTGVGFTDTLPAGLLISAPNGLTGTCGGGAILATAGTNTISLTGATLAVNSMCTFSVNVTGTTSGIKLNESLPVTSNEGGPGNTAKATLTVGPPLPPVISKLFNPNTVILNGSSTLSFSITNPNATAALTGVGFTDTLPAGLIISTPNGLTGTCGGGTITALAGTNTIGLAGASLVGNGTCTFSLSVSGIALGLQTNTTSTVTSNETVPGNPATATITVGPPQTVEVTDAYQIQYIPNLNVGDGVVNITNAGSLGADPFGPFSGTTGRICVNVYTFSPDEQEISCCSCLVTPNALVHLGAKTDLIGNTLTSVVPNSIVVKLLATIPLGTANPGGTQGGPFTGSTCNAASPFDTTNLAPGMRAWATKLHALPTSPVTYGVTEGRFQAEPLSPGELAKLTNLCRFIVGNGSGAGICKSCTLGGLGADKK